MVFETSVIRVFQGAIKTCYKQLGNTLKTFCGDRYSMIIMASFVINDMFYSSVLNVHRPKVS